MILFLQAYSLFLSCRHPVQNDSTDNDVGNDTFSSDTADSEFTPTFSVNIEGRFHAWIEESVSLEGVLTINSPLEDERAVTQHWSCSDGTTSYTSTITLSSTSPQTIECTYTVTDTISNYSDNKSHTVQFHDAPEWADWTVLIYMAADNNLEESALLDIEEMEAIGSGSMVNILVQLDRPPEPMSNNSGRNTSRSDSPETNNTGANRYYITQNQSPSIDSIPLQHLGEIDSGDPMSAADFFNWGLTNFPSERTAIIFWNHGWSWTLAPSTPLFKGIASDDSTGNDISIAKGELTEIFETLQPHINVPIDLVGMDACTMQSWEIATTLAPFAKTFVASQDYVSLSGWEYTGFLRDLIENPEMDSTALGQSIAHHFYNSGDSTISSIHLQELSSFNEKLNVLSNALLVDHPELLLDAARQTYSYDGSTHGMDHDLFGLLDSLKQIHTSPVIHTALENVLAMEGTIIHTNLVQDSYVDARGLSIYSPVRADGTMLELYRQASWADATLWDELIQEALQNTQ